jgi:hypothetical protein
MPVKYKIGMEGIEIPISNTCNRNTAPLLALATCTLNLLLTTVLPVMHWK